MQCLHCMQYFKNQEPREACTLFVARITDTPSADAGWLPHTCICVGRVCAQVSSRGCMVDLEVEGSKTGARKGRMQIRRASALLQDKVARSVLNGCLFSLVHWGLFDETGVSVQACF